jgi:hypothetical protein
MHGKTTIKIVASFFITLIPYKSRNVVTYTQVSCFNASVLQADRNVAGYIC